jgi:hypothetical protein
MSDIVRIQAGAIAEKVPKLKRNTKCVFFIPEDWKEKVHARE